MINTYNKENLFCKFEQRSINIFSVKGLFGVPQLLCALAAQKQPYKVCKQTSMTVFPSHKKISFTKICCNLTTPALEVEVVCHFLIGIKYLPSLLK